jgi:tetratricopeptide (TPR) repeat protein
MGTLLAVLLLSGTPALAQDRAGDLGDTAAAPPEAREQYRIGLEAMENGRWADALGAFRRSYELNPTVPALYNQGVVLRSLGRLREARDTFARLLDEHPDAPADAREAANEMGREVAERIAELVVLNLPAPRFRLGLRLDGAPIDDPGDRPLSLEVDPGEHTLGVLREGYDPFEWRGALGDGEQREVRVELEKTGIPLWAWIAAGSGVVLGAVIVVVLLATQESEQTRVHAPMVSP